VFCDLDYHRISQISQKLLSFGWAICRFFSMGVIRPRGLGEIGRHVRERMGNLACSASLHWARRHWVEEYDLASGGLLNEQIFVFSNSAGPMGREFGVSIARSSGFPVPDGIIN
jgi:hypothetical protein